MNFTQFPHNLVLRVHPKSEEISLDSGKKLFWELVPCVKVTLVSKFHPIWCPIAQESMLGVKGQILWEKRVSRYLLLDKFQNSWTLSGPTPDIVRPRVFSPMFVHSFGHILLTGWRIDPIFSTAFVTSRESFPRCRLVYPSPSCSVLALGGWTWDIARFL
jgi:hypothetical protein